MQTRYRSLAVESRPSGASFGTATGSSRQSARMFEQAVVTSGPTSPIGSGDKDLRPGAFRFGSRRSLGPCLFWVTAPLKLNVTQSRPGTESSQLGFRKGSLEPLPRSSAWRHDEKRSLGFDLSGRFSLAVRAFGSAVAAKVFN